MTGSIEKLKHEYNIEINYKAYPLRKGIPDEGVLLEDYMKGAIVNLDQMRANFKKMAGENGLPASNLERIINSGYAQELSKWAEEKGCGDEFHKEAFLAYYGYGKNLADIEVLKEVAEKSGLNKDEVEDALKDQKYKDLVDKDWKEAVDRELVAAPTFFIGDLRLVGAQSYEKLARFVECGGAFKIEQN